MADVCSWCGKEIQEGSLSPLDMVCARCWAKAKNERPQDYPRPWENWSRGCDYNCETRKRTDRYT